MPVDTYSTTVEEIDLEMDALKTHLATIDVTHSIETYEGTEHGFDLFDRTLR